jgi:hypothetical protein
MDADEIYPLSRDAIRNLLQARQSDETDSGPLGKRRLPRWPFPGTIELWLPTPGGREEHMLGTLRDLSETGVGMRGDVEVKTGQVLSIAVHQPEASFHGQATVRHCTAHGTGYYVGLEFKFD